MSIFVIISIFYDNFLCVIGLSILTYVRPVDDLWLVFTLVGALHQLRRFIALRPKDEQEERSTW